VRKGENAGWQRRAQFKNKAGMCMITKPLPFLESPESWNVYENIEVIRESWNVVDGRGDTLGRGTRFLIMLLKACALTYHSRECH
jgi:hypothetical protein